MSSDSKHAPDHTGLNPDALPDLYEALELMLSQHGCGCCAGNRWEEAKEAGRAAIAKAKEARDVD